MSTVPWSKTLPPQKSHTQHFQHPPDVHVCKPLHGASNCARHTVASRQTRGARTRTESRTVTVFTTLIEARNNRHWREGESRRTDSCRRHQLASPLAKPLCYSAHHTSQQLRQQWLPAPAPLLSLICSDPHMQWPKLRPSQRSGDPYCAPTSPPQVVMSFSGPSTRTRGYWFRADEIPIILMPSNQ